MVVGKRMPLDIHSIFGTMSSPSPSEIYSDPSPTMQFSILRITSSYVGSGQAEKENTIRCPQCSL